jgi:hypothetical protein
MSLETILNSKEIMDAFNIYKKQIPDVGVVSLGQADELLEKGQICRGKIIENDEIEFFHIVKSPTSFPEKSIFSGETELSLFQMLIFMGMKKDIDLDDMLNDD